MSTTTRIIAMQFVCLNTSFSPSLPPPSIPPSLPPSHTHPFTHSLHLFLPSLFLPSIFSSLPLSLTHSLTPSIPFFPLSFPPSLPSCPLQGAGGPGAKPYRQKVGHLRVDQQGEISYKKVRASKFKNIYIV